MKIFNCIAAVLILSMVSIPLASPESASLQHYRLIDLGRLGGPSNAGNAINNAGWVTGFSLQTDGAPVATLWVKDREIFLGTLGGPGSDVPWPVKNNFGLISGVSENGVHDPLNETFSCPAFGLASGNSCVAFVWQQGLITQLPGLGGNNSIGAGDNSVGQVVGWAEKNVNDATCALPTPGAVQYLQFEATLWQRDSRGGWQVRELPPYPGDPDGAATAINDLSQAVGISGQCDVAIGALSAIHALLWDHGKPFDLGNLGGHGWNTPTAINNRGVITGFVNGPNDLINGQLQIRWVSFIWTAEHGMQSIGTLAGDAMSQTTDINDKNEIVGVSYSDYLFDNPRAFIYVNGSMTALNSLIGSSSADWDVTSTGGINDQGEIAAQANVVSNGVVTSEAHAVLLVPCGKCDPGTNAAVQDFLIPEDVQEQMRRQVRVAHYQLRITPQ